MAITATLVFQGRNRLRYLIAATAGGGEAVSIESDGGATPDLLTDSIAGPIKNIANVKANGYGLIAPSGLSTQAMAQALLNSNAAASLVGPNLPTCMMELSNRTTATSNFDVVAVRGPSDVLTPGITITANGIGTCYLDLYVPGSIGP